MIARRWRVTVAGGHPLTRWSPRLEWNAIQALQASKRTTCFVTDDIGGGIEIRDQQIVNVVGDPDWHDTLARILNRTRTGALQ